MSCISVSLINGLPLIRVLIGVSLPRQQALLSAGQLVPNPVPATLLIDTGASATLLDPQTVSGLGLAPTGAIPIQTPSTGTTPHMCNQFDVALLIQSQGVGPPFAIGALPIVEAAMQHQGFDGLLGRDVLSRCALIYQGQTGQYTLCY